MFRSLQTSESWPSFERSRFTPPTSTPSVVESMKVVPLKSTMTSLPPWPITSRSCCLNSGAVYRSTSPASEMTYVSSLSCSVLMSKFTRIPPARCRAESKGQALLLAQLLDQLPDGSGRRAVGVELEVPLVGGDRRRRVAGRLRGLAELEPRVRAPRLEVRHLLVRGDGARRGALHLGREVVHARVHLCGRRLLDRVRPERLPERARRAREDDLVRRRELLGRVCALVLGQIALRALELEAAELAPRLHVLRSKVRVVLQRADREQRVALRLVRGGEVAEALRVLRVVLDLLQRLRDGRPARVEDVEVVEELREAARPGADTEERERGGKEEGEDEVHRLRPPPHAHEEELLVRVTASRMATPAARSRLRGGLGLRLLSLLRLDRRARHRPLRVPLRGRPAAFARRARRARSSPRTGPTSAAARGTSSPGRGRAARAR